MKEYEAKKIKSNANRIIIYKPDYVHELSKGSHKIYINNKNGYWICLGEKGQNVLAQFDSKPSVYISELVDELSEENDEEAEMLYHLIKICLDKNILMIQTGEDYCPQPQSMKINDMNLAEITWALSGFCNLSCKHCYNSNNLSSKTIYDENLENDILNAIKSFCVNATITGGEPFAHPRILHFIEELAGNLKQLMILTNGVLIDESKAEFISQYKNIKVQISLDGCNAEIHEKIRGKGTFGKTLNAISLLKKRDVNVVISMVPMGTNINELEGLIELAEKHDIKSLHFPLFQEFGSGKENRDSLAPDIDKLCAFFDVTMGQMEKGRIHNGHNYLMKKSIKEPPTTYFTNCGVGRGALIDYNGDVYPCSGLYEERFLAGNIRKNDIRDIYLNSNVFRKLRRISSDNIPECSSCAFKVYCSGGCRSRALYANSDILSVDPYCKLYKHELESYLWKMAIENNDLSIKQNELEEVMELENRC